MSKHINKLSRENSYQLARHFDSPDGKVMLAKEGDDTLAQSATKALGFHVNALNIRGVRQLLGVRKRAANGTKSADQEALIELVETQAKKIERLEHNVQNLLDRMVKCEQKPR